MTLKMDIKTFTMTDHIVDSAYSSDNNSSTYAKPHLKNHIDTIGSHNTDTDLSSQLISLINELQLYRKIQELNDQKLREYQQRQKLNDQKLKEYQQQQKLNDQKLNEYQQQQIMNEHKICHQGQEIQELRDLLVKTLPKTENNVQPDDKEMISDNIVSENCPDVPVDNNALIETEKHINLNTWKNIYKYQQLCNKTSTWSISSKIPELTAEKVRLANGKGYEYVHNYFHDIEKSVSDNPHILKEVILSKLDKLLPLMIKGTPHLKTLTYKEIKTAILNIATKPDFMISVEELYAFTWDGTEDPVLYASKLRNKCLLATHIHDKDFNFEQYLIPGLTNNMNKDKRKACVTLLQDTTQIHDVLEYIANVFTEKGRNYFFETKQATGYKHNLNNHIYYMPLIPFPIYQPFISIQG